MRIALAEYNIIWEDKEANLYKLEMMMAACNNMMVDLLLLPEMSLTGFSMNTSRTQDISNETIYRVDSLVRTYGVAVGVGWVMGQVEKCENHYTIITPEQGVILDYAKIHPFGYAGENNYFKGGNILKICEYKDFRIGAAICYDLRFPEIFQKMSYMADLIVVPANWPETRNDHWKTLLKARAIETQSYVAGINCVGAMFNQYYTGDSALYGPDGRKLSYKIINLNKNFSQEEKIFVFDIENNVAEIRATFPIKPDRREDLYRNIEVEY